MKMEKVLRSALLLLLAACFVYYLVTGMRSLYTDASRVFPGL